MRKSQELSSPNSCINKAHDDEMTFVLLGRDVTAPATIRFWIEARIAQGKNNRSDAQIIEAEECAKTIERELKAK